MTSRIDHQIVLLPKFLVGQFDRLTRVIDNTRVAEINRANPPIALEAARGVFNLDRNNLAASLLAEFRKGKTFKIMLGDVILGHHATPVEPARRPKKWPQNVTEPFLSTPLMAQVLVRDCDRFRSVPVSAHLRLSDGFNKRSIFDKGSNALIPVQRFQPLFRGKGIGLNPATLRTSTGLDQEIEVALSRMLFAHDRLTRRFYARSDGLDGRPTLLN